ncbi:MAG: hypothetical protein FWD17_19340 [Polyangiaceae bacterium]|nr:hypothetical protein [Polyangiaceae bacterium]
MSATTNNLFVWMDRLTLANIHFTMGTSRDNAVMLKVTVPGERWEVEFFPDGEVEVERYRSTGKIEGVEALEELVAVHGG